MTNKILMKAILAMDSYNRGYGQKIENLPDPETVSADQQIKIGNAIINKQSDIDKDRSAVQNSFYAISYTYDDKTIISYRGTDNTSVLPGGDVWNGWIIGGGFYKADQAYMGADFYKAVIGDVNPLDANVEFVGHSLGGGLAGFMARLYGKEAVIFDNMPFELASYNAYLKSTDHTIEVEVKVDDLTFETMIVPVLADQELLNQYYFNGATPQPFPLNSTNPNITAYAVKGELLGYTLPLRDQQTTPVNEIDSHSVNQGGSDLHSQALLITLLYARDVVGNADWNKVGKELMDALFSNNTAKSLGIMDNEEPTKGSADKMLIKIAYSALHATGDNSIPNGEITNDELVFGDTAIRALFNDANELGKAMGVNNLTDVFGTTIDPVDFHERKIIQESIAKMLVQFAGKLAEDKVLYSSHAEAVEGMLSLSADSGSLTLNVSNSSNSLWETTTPFEKEKMLNELYLKFRITDTSIMPNAADVDRITLAATDNGITNESFTETSADTSVIFGADGNDVLQGSDGLDFLIGGRGSDTLKGGAGNDILDGGAQDANHFFNQGLSSSDTLEGGADSDTYIFNGNFGNDTIIDDGLGNESTGGLKDKIKIDGTILSGEAEYLSEGVYELKIGLKKYQINTSGGANGGALTIINGSTSNTITTTNFTSGDFGITIEDKPEDQDLSDNIDDSLNSLSQAEATDPNQRIDPLVLDLNNNGQIDLISLNDSNAFFDLENGGLKNKVGWVDSGDGFLVLDENNNGVVDNIDELFGYQDENGNTVTGTQELATHDSNQDGKINSNDAVFEQLKIWQDLDGDGITDAGELKSLSEYNITSISTDTPTPIDQNVAGNVILSTGSYEYETTQIDPETGESTTVTNSSIYGNLDLAIDQTNSESYTYQDNQGNTISPNINLETLLLPFSRGYGDAKAWHIAMSENETLLTMMQDMVNLTNGVSLENLDQKIEEFIYEWTGASNITGMRGEFDGQKLAAMEEVRGVDFVDIEGSSNVGVGNVNLVQAAWDSLFKDVKNKIVIQGTFKDQFEGAYYDYVSDSVKSYSGDFISYNEFLLGDASDNVLTGNGSMNSNTISVGGKGDDIINSRYGNDTYIYNKGDGNDTISDLFGDDKIIFGIDIIKEDIYLTTSGGNLIINFRNYPNDSIIIKSQFSSRARPIEFLEFANNEGGNGDLPIDIADANNLDYEYYGTDGNDDIRSSYGNSTIDSGPGDDVISTRSGDNTIDAGLGDDTINGGNGNDYYLYKKGDGKDVISDIDGVDRIIFDASISKDDIYFTTEHQNLIIHFTNSPEDSITINSQFSSDQRAIEVLQFSNGDPEINIVNLPDLVIEYTGSERNDNIIAKYSGHKLINAGAGDDYIYSYQGKTAVINAGDGNDNISINFGDDVVNGGKGNDAIYSYGGNLERSSDDTYLFSKGDGQDTITDNYGNDKIIFDSNISKDDVYFEAFIPEGSTNPRDLIIRFVGSDDTITIKFYFFVEQVYRMEILQFANGDPEINLITGIFEHQGTDGNDVVVSYLGKSIINSGAGDDVITTGMGDDEISSGDGNDTINSGYGNDIINAGKGDDIIGVDDNNYGDDTYIYNKGDGKDIINEFAIKGNNNYYDDLGSDTIILGSEISRSDVYFSMDSSGSFNEDLIINFRNSPNDSITIKNQLGYYAGDKIEVLQFANNDGGNGDSAIDLTNISALTFEYSGTDGDDVIDVFFYYPGYGEIIHNIINTGDGNDIINPSYGSDDIINAGKGDDIIGQSRGNHGDDTYIYNQGDGKDTIHEMYSSGQGGNYSYGNDVISFGDSINQSDISLTVSGHDLIINFNNSPDDLITIKNHFRSEVDRVETLKFNDGSLMDINPSVLTFEYQGTEGDDVINGSDYNDIINAGDGNDIIQAGSGDDVVNAGKGDDIIGQNGYGLGDDTYIYQIGDGADIITDYDYNNGSDNITFGVNINQSDIYFSANGVDLIINFRNSPNDSITIKNHINQAYYRIETLKFNDGSLMDINPSVLTFEYQGTEGDDVINGSDYNDIINAGDGNDIIQAGSGDDVVNAGKGDDIIGQNNGNAGDDTYLYQAGDGKDIITESTYYSNSSNGNDNITFGDAINQSDVFFSKNNNDLIILFRNAPDDKITITNQFQSEASRIETLKFNDGSTIDISSPNVLQIEYAGTNGDDYINAGDGNDNINGLDGNDTIYGNGGNDTLTGGLGNDRLEGGAGNDTYIYNIGDGNDVINDYGYSGSSVDSLIINGLTSIDDVAFSRNVNNGLLIKIIATGETITIENHFQSETYKVESLQLMNNGVAIDNIDLTALGNMPIVGTSGDDYISGGNDDDVITGNAGNDTLSGSGGNDSYIYNVGDGNDTIFEYASNDDLDSSNSDSIIINGVNSIDDIELSRTINVEYSMMDYSLSENNNSLIITILSTGETITVRNHFNDTGNQVESLQLFNNNGVLVGNIDLTAFNPEIVGTDGDDTLSGGNLNDTIIGGLGNDTLQGNSGNDSYIYNIGDGNDVISDTNGNNDSITINGVTTLSDIELSRNGYDLTIKILSTDNTIKITNHFYYSTVESLHLVNNGSEIGNIDLTAFNPPLNGTSGDDVISGGSVDEHIQGFAGNDILSGNGGDDTYIYNLGDGSDTINNQDSNGLDIIQFGSGISSSDVSFEKVNNDLVFSIGFNYNDKITLTDFYGYSSTSQVDELHFSDGEIWDLSNDETFKLILNGTQNNDNLNGTSAGEVIRGLGGDDQINGGGGKDIIYGDDGNDTINSYDGGSTIDGGNGNDNIQVYSMYGGSNNISGGAGDDTIYVSDVYNQYGADVINGGDGNDNITFYGTQNSVNIINGGNGDDIINVNGGNNIINGGLGNDTLTGGAGNDAFIIEAGNNNNTTTIADFEFSNPNEKIDLSAFTGIENFDDLNIVADPIDGSTIINLPDGQNVHIVNITPNDLTENNFVFYASIDPADPEALDISIITNEDFSKIIDVLASASDANGDHLVIDSITNPNNGTATIITNPQTGYQTISYTPNYNYYGDDSFDYTISDGTGGFVTKTVTVNINSVNDTPFASLIVSQVRGVTKIIDVLKRTFDNDGDILTVSNITTPTHGTATIITNPQTGYQTISYTPNSNYVGSDSLEYTISDGNGGFTTRTINIDVTQLNNAPTINVQIEDQSARAGSPYNFIIPSDAFSDLDGDVLTYSVTLADGSPLPNGLYFNSYSNSISGNLPHGTAQNLSIVVNASDGYDSAAQTFNLDVEDNTIATTSGDDNIIGTELGDFVFETGGNNVINTADGNDFIITKNSGDNIINGGAGNDGFYIGGSGNNVVNGGDGFDFIYAIDRGENPFAQVDLADLSYSTGNNIFEGGAGNDSIFGGAGDDTYIFNIGDGADYIGEGAISNPTIVDDGQNYDIDNGYDKIKFGSGITTSNIYFERGGYEQNDLIIKFTDNVTDQILISGQFSENKVFVIEEIEFSDGSKLTLPNLENPSLDIVIDSNNAPTINQVITNQSTTAGNPFTFTLPTDSFTDIDGDTLTYSAAIDDGNGGTLSFPTWLTFNPETKTFTGTSPLSFSGNISLIVIASDGSLESSQNFSLNIQNDMNVIEGTNEDDNLAGSQGNDLLEGGIGNDTIIAGSGDDMIFGGDGDDIIKASMGDDFIDGGAGADNIRAGNGIDTISYQNSSSAVNVILINGWTHNKGGDAQGDILYGVENLIGSDHNDMLQGNSDDNIITGGEGDDFSYGAAGNDTLIGGLGDDVAIGGEGSDTYIYNQNDGLDVYSELLDGQANGADKIKFGAGIAQEDLSFLLDNNNNLIINFNNSPNDQIKIYSQFTPESQWHESTIETLEFNDGSTLDISSRENLTFQINGTVNDDNIAGSDYADQIDGKEGSDIITGGEGQDVMTGGVGNDNFVFNFFSDSSNTINTADIITDFAQGEDKIDLHNLNLLDHFITLDENPNDVSIPEGLSYHFGNDNNTIIEHHDGNSENDFAIKLMGHVELGNGDFEF